MSEINLKSKFLERCVKEYLGLGDSPIMDTDLAQIKYLRIATTHDHEMSLGKNTLPKDFYFDDAGDEWNFCSLDDTGRFAHIEEFIEVAEYYPPNKELSIKDELRQHDWSEPNYDEAAMQNFNEDVVTYWAEEDDYSFAGENDELFFAEDLAYFTNVEALRLNGCEQDIHNIAFLGVMNKLRVLELGEIRLNSMDGIEKLIGLETLCIWSN
ncbi:MAG: hypothetical protein E7478_04660 [Ruminococcaceae bacterium]|nr:hypothetical protein [Oscillospiraceae bacterium]